MALIRGTGSHAPCPRCLVTEGDMWNPSVCAPLRTSAGTSATIERAKQEKVKDKKEEILKSAGLRDVEVLSPRLVLLLHSLMAPFRMYFGR